MFVKLEPRHGAGTVVNVATIVSAVARGDDEGFVDVLYHSGHREEFADGTLDVLSGIEGFVSLTRIRDGRAFPCLVNAVHVGRFASSPTATYVHFIHDTGEARPFVVRETAEEIWSATQGLPSSPPPRPAP